jgi:hypothetical protein
VSGGEDTPERVGVALRLYVAADSAPSTLARRQLVLVRERLGGVDWEVEVVDVFECPEVGSEQPFTTYGRARPRRGGFARSTVYSSARWLLPPG